MTPARLFAALYDRTLAASEAAGLREWRRELLARAHGDVLELGAGTGANVGLYPEGARVTYTEPEAPMAARLRARGAEVVQAPAERLPFADASFDVVVTTLVLCTVRDVEQTLQEVRRVLRPGGRLLLMEHVRHPDPARARWQDRLTPLQRRLGRGCHLNRDTPELLRAAGFAVDVEQRHFPKGPKVVQPIAFGTATP